LIDFLEPNPLSLFIQFDVENRHIYTSLSFILMRKGRLEIDLDISPREKRFSNSLYYKNKHPSKDPFDIEKIRKGTDSVDKETEKSVFRTLN